MARIAAFYTAQSLVAPVTKAVSELMPGAKLVNIVDDTFISDVVQNGGMNVDLGKRLLRHLEAAEASGADYLFSTCSSIGDYIEGARRFIRVPIVRIDAAMAMQAVGQGRTIAVLATLDTTLGPTVRLVRRHAAQRGKEITVVEGLATGAFAALQRGDLETHDRLIVETAHSVASDVDLYLLAQGSMAGAATAVSKITGKAVLSSLQSGVAYLKEVVEKGADANT